MNAVRAISAMAALGEVRRFRGRDEEIYSLFSNTITFLSLLEAKLEEDISLDHLYTLQGIMGQYIYCKGVLRALSLPSGEYITPKIIRKARGLWPIAVTSNLIVTGVKDITTEEESNGLDEVADGFYAKEGKSPDFFFFGTKSMQDVFFYVLKSKKAHEVAEKLDRNETISKLAIEWGMVLRYLGLSEDEKTGVPGVIPKFPELKKNGE